MSNRLDRFYAVTRGPLSRSIYLAEATANGPVVTKIFLEGDDSPRVGTKLGNGTMLSIGRQLWMYIPEGHSPVSSSASLVRELGEVNTHYWGGHTSAVVALFKTEEEAVQCVKKAGLWMPDPAWMKETLEVLDLIGTDHPVFTITRHPDLALIKGWQPNMPAAA